MNFAAPMEGCGRTCYDPRATTTEPRKEAVKPKIERASGIVKSSVDGKTAGELRWEKPNARMGKEITEKYRKHNRTGNGENINRNTIYPVEVQ